MRALLGRLADRHGLISVIMLLLAVMFVAACQTLALPPVGRHDRLATAFPPASDEIEASAIEQRVGLPGEAS